MGLDESGMQPFALGDDRVVCNGELYGFKAMRDKLKDKYEFHSQSDCEIILPMYREFGTDMFAMLDAEFAMIIYDGETKQLIAAPSASARFITAICPTALRCLRPSQKTLSACAATLCRFLPDIITRTASSSATAT